MGIILNMLKQISNILGKPFLKSRRDTIFAEAGLHWWWDGKTTSEVGSPTPRSYFTGIGAATNQAFGSPSLWNSHYMIQFNSDMDFTESISLTNYHKITIPLTDLPPARADGTYDDISIMLRGLTYDRVTGFNLSLIGSDGITIIKKIGIQISASDYNANNYSIGFSPSPKNGSGCDGSHHQWFSYFLAGADIAAYNDGTNIYLALCGINFRFTNIEYISGFAIVKNFRGYQNREGREINNSLYGGTALSAGSGFGGSFYVTANNNQSYDNFRVPIASIDYDIFVGFVRYNACERDNNHRFYLVGYDITNIKNAFEPSYVSYKNTSIYNQEYSFIYSCKGFIVPQSLVEAHYKTLNGQKYLEFNIKTQMSVSELLFSVWSELIK